MSKNNAEDKDHIVLNAGLAGASAETVQRYGSAVKEHLVAYSGMDNESSKKLSKGLKEISKYKISSDFKDSNIKQQAGFSAEVKTVARENAKKIIDGNSNSRTTRTDDMIKQSNGKGGFIGGVNEQLYDIAEVDRNGVFVEGTARQLKFVGGSPTDCTNKILSGKYDKYREAGAAIEIPSDYYDAVKKDLSEKALKLKEQIKSAQERGDSEVLAKKTEQLKKIEKTQGSLKKSTLSNAEAIEARLHPKLSTAKDIAKISHQAGLEQAAIGATIGGFISLTKNVVQLIKGDKTVTAAMKDVSNDTVKAGGVSYLGAFAGATIKGAFQNSSKSYVRALSKTNLPATVVSSVSELGKTLYRYAQGKIDGTECLTEVGEKGTAMIASSLGATVGQVLIPVPIIGGLVGGMIGYSMSSAYYNSLLASLQDAKLAHEDRLRIEAECEEAIRELKEYQLEIELVISNYMQEHIEVFNEAFIEMEKFGLESNIDGFIQGANKVTRKLGGKPLFDTKKEFDGLMDSSSIIKI